MPKSNWREQLTLGIAITFYLVWMWPLISSFIPPLEYDPAHYVTDAQRDEGRQDQETYAQIWMAWASWIQVVLGFAGLIGLGVTIYFARLAWVESREAALQARRSADIAHRELMEGDRPEITVVTVGDSIAKSFRDTMFPYAIFKGINTGGRAAIIQNWGAEFFPSNLNPPIPAREIFGERFIRSHQVVATGKDFTISATREAWTDEERASVQSGDTVIYLCGYIEYTDKLGALWEAGFAFWFWHVKQITVETGTEIDKGIMRPFGGAAYNFDRARKAEDPKDN